MLIALTWLCFIILGLIVCIDCLLLLVGLFVLVFWLLVACDALCFDFW